MSPKSSEDVDVDVLYASHMGTISLDDILKQEGIMAKLGLLFRDVKEELGNSRLKKKSQDALSLVGLHHQAVSSKIVYALEVAKIVGDSPPRSSASRTDKKDNSANIFGVSSGRKGKGIKGKALTEVEEDGNDSIPPIMEDNTDKITGASSDRKGKGSRVGTRMG
ncbi:OLC1v1024781C1 [Oldenlandia corymbosa var. corymbosa]|uniref:OLC1v1024781C1 n=1 Tax=Oldenlandia corymbosa var. corymbosa TaxID=529605 RepID=A0AAV1C3J8_OLDCO|nr:OLC1v1024781C1 [Oldenlandia corymbosa var. corymbosa]